MFTAVCMHALAYTNEYMWNSIEYSKCLIDIHLYIGDFDSGLWATQILKLCQKQSNGNKQRYRDKK